jgi:hypothetical protein
VLRLPLDDENQSTVSVSSSLLHLSFNPIQISYSHEIPEQAQWLPQL